MIGRLQAVPHFAGHIRVHLNAIEDQKKRQAVKTEVLQELGGLGFHRMTVPDPSNPDRPSADAKHHLPVTVFPNETDLALKYQKLSETDIFVGVSGTKPVDQKPQSDPNTIHVATVTGTKGLPRPTYYQTQVINVPLDAKIRARIAEVLQKEGLGDKESQIIETGSVHGHGIVSQNGKAVFVADYDVAKPGQIRHAGELMAARRALKRTDGKMNDTVPTSVLAFDPKHAVLAHEVHVNGGQISAMAKALAEASSASRHFSKVDRRQQVHHEQRQMGTAHDSHDPKTPPSAGHPSKAGMPAMKVTVTDTK